MCFARFQWTLHEIFNRVFWYAYASTNQPFNSTSAILIFFSVLSKVDCAKEGWWRLNTHITNSKVFIIEEQKLARNYSIMISVKLPLHCRRLHYLSSKELNRTTLTYYWSHYSGRQNDYVVGQLHWSCKLKLVGSFAVKPIPFTNCHTQFSNVKSNKETSSSHRHQAGPFFPILPQLWPSPILINGEYTIQNLFANLTRSKS